MRLALLGRITSGACNAALALVAHGHAVLRSTSRSGGSDLRSKKRIEIDPTLQCPRCLGPQRSLEQRSD